MQDNELIGLTLAEAKEKLKDSGSRIRVTSEDGQQYFGTCDYDLNRINVAIAEGKISSVGGRG